MPLTSLIVWLLLIGLPTTLQAGSARMELAISQDRATQAEYWPGAVRTDAEGRYEVVGLPSGAYAFRIRARGRTPSAAAERISPITACLLVT